MIGTALAQRLDALVEEYNREASTVYRLLPTVAAGQLYVQQWGVFTRHSRRCWAWVVGNCPVLEIRRFITKENLYEEEGGRNLALRDPGAPRHEARPVARGDRRGGALAHHSARAAGLGDADKEPLLAGGPGGQGRAGARRLPRATPRAQAAVGARARPLRARPRLLHHPHYRRRDPRLGRLRSAGAPRPRLRRRRRRRRRPGLPP